MPKREDGKETRKRILDAACELFAKKGYQHARVADICQRAGTNAASVNYYFGDKKTLYIEAWQHTFYECFNPDLLEYDNASPEDQLRIYIHNLMQNFRENNTQGQFTRLYMMELVNPTGLIQNVWRELIEPRRRELQGIIRKITKDKITDEMVLFCELSIINQCRVLLTVSRNDMEFLLKQPISSDLIKRLADHIVCFSLSGIKAVSQYE